MAEFRRSKGRDTGVAEEEDPKSGRREHRSERRGIELLDGLRRRHRIAFVLSGGGNLGATQVGMLRALLEHGVIPDVVLGCSIGAMNGAAFAADPTSEGLQRLTEIWESAVTSGIMPSSRIPNAVQMLRRGQSIHDNAELRSGIEMILDDRSTFEELSIGFQCNAADVESATTHWFKEGDLVEALLASAALPAVYPPMTIGDRTYIDGGVIENVPISRAVELGCRTIYVLHMGPHGRFDHELKRPLDGALQAYWVARNSQFARDLGSLPDRIEAIVLPPGERPELKHDDFSHTDELIEKGYLNTSSFLEENVDSQGRRKVRDDADGGRGPIERLVLGARSIKWRQLVRQTASAPEGGIVGAVDKPDLESSSESPEEVASEHDDPSS